MGTLQRGRAPFNYTQFRVYLYTTKSKSCNWISISRYRY